MANSRTSSETILRRARYIFLGLIGINLIWAVVFLVVTFRMYDWQEDIEKPIVASIERFNAQIQEYADEQNRVDLNEEKMQLPEYKSESNVQTRININNNVGGSNIKVRTNYISPTPWPTYAYPKSRTTVHRDDWWEESKMDYEQRVAQQNKAFEEAKAASAARMEAFKQESEKNMDEFKAEGEIKRQEFFEEHGITE